MSKTADFAASYWTYIICKTKYNEYVENKNRPRSSSNNMIMGMNMGMSMGMSMGIIHGAVHGHNLGLSMVSGMTAGMLIGSAIDSLNNSRSSYSSSSKKEETPNVLTKEVLDQATEDILNKQHWYGYQMPSREEIAKFKKILTTKIDEDIARDNGCVIKMGSNEYSTQVAKAADEARINIYWHNVKSQDKTDMAIDKTKVKIKPYLCYDYKLIYEDAPVATI